MRWFLLVLILITSSFTAAFAQENISTHTIYACSSISSDAERLACYDEAVSRFRDAETSGEVTTIRRSDLVKLNRDSFGLSLPSIPRNILPRFGNGDSSELDVIVEPVEKVERLRYDNLRIVLENGQIWEQTDSKQININKRQGVESAEIKRAALGSFKMQLDGGRSFRAKRIK